MSIRRATIRSVLMGLKLYRYENTPHKSIGKPIIVNMTIVMMTVVIVSTREIE